MSIEQQIVFLPYVHDQVIDGEKTDAADVTRMAALAEKGWRVVQIAAGAGGSRDGVYVLVERPKR